MKRDTLIIIPAYNEEESIGALLELIDVSGARQFADVLVIDDCSTDQTGAIVRAHGYRTIRNIFNLGYGSAIQLGYKYAVRRHYDYVIQMDGDGQHDVKNIQLLHDALTEVDPKTGKTPDIVIGSRFMPGSQSFALSWLKKFAMKLFSDIVYLFTKERVWDTTSGLQGLSFNAFLYYSKYNNFNARYPDANMLTQMLMRGFIVKEIPSIMHEREAGVSMHRGLFKQITYMLIMMVSITTVAMRERKLAHKLLKRMRNEEQQANA